MQPINFFNVKVINVGLVIQINIETQARAYGCSILIVFEDALTYDKQEQTTLSRTLKASKLLYPMKAFGCRERPLESTS